jgi:hypothetical protein
MIKTGTIGIKRELNAVFAAESVEDAAIDAGDARCGSAENTHPGDLGYNDPSATHEMAVDLFRVISRSADQAQLHFFNRCGHSTYHEYPQELTNL